jgi:hypothetical protein
MTSFKGSTAFSAPTKMSAQFGLSGFYTPLTKAGVEISPQKR